MYQECSERIKIFVCGQCEHENEGNIYYCECCGAVIEPKNVTVEFYKIED